MCQVVDVTSETMLDKSGSYSWHRNLIKNCVHHSESVQGFLQTKFKNNGYTLQELNYRQTIQETCCTLYSKFASPLFDIYLQNQQIHFHMKRMFLPKHVSCLYCITPWDLQKRVATMNLGPMYEVHIEGCGCNRKRFPVTPTTHTPIWIHKRYNKVVSVIATFSFFKRNHLFFFFHSQA